MYKFVDTAREEVLIKNNEFVSFLRVLCTLKVVLKQKMAPQIALMAKDFLFIILLMPQLYSSVASQLNKSF